MPKLLKAAAALMCAVGLHVSAYGQMTTITATSIKMGGTPITAGSVTLTPVDANGKPIAFVQGGGGLNSPHPFNCKITAGAITGICQVPDSALTTPARISYSIQISSTPSQKAVVLNAIPNITGSTWPLDEYAPAANTTNVEPIQVSYGTAAPSESCVSPSFYSRAASGGLLYMCVNSAWVLVTGSGGGSASVTPESMSDAVATLTGCSDVTKSWSPAANACVSNTGPTGATGAKGDKGDGGAIGATGPAGSTGPAGATATINIGTVTTGSSGTSAAVSNGGSPSVAVLNFTIPRGATGETGATGAKGDKGDTGDQGPQGIQGAKGDIGATGSTGAVGTAASISVGTVTQLASGATPTVTNVGTSSAAVFNFGLPGTSTAIENVQVALPTAAIPANSCTAASTVSMSGLTTTSVIETAFGSDSATITGWGQVGGLTFIAWPTSDTLHWRVCNVTSDSITPDPLTLNVGGK